MKNAKRKSEGKEPELLRQGKKFQKEVKQRWPKKGAKFEKGIKKPSGRKGRMDIFMDARTENDEKLVAVVEIKASDWDRMTLEAVKRNVRRQANQIWDYIESQIEEGKHISPGIVFPKRPKDPERLKLIEELFDEKCIAVSWEDESLDERKTRS